MPYKFNGREIFPSAEMYHDAVPYAAGITMREFFTDPVKCAEAWREAFIVISDKTGGRVKLRDPSPAPFSYGHVVCLGASAVFPEDGEPNVKPLLSSVGDGLELLRGSKNMDFTGNDLFKYYIETGRVLREYFPDRNVPVISGFGSQGPVTTAMLLRGQDFLLDIYDEPEKSVEFLRLISESVVEYQKCLRRLNGQPEISESTGLTDDFSSLIPPDMWPEFVIPFINQIFTGLAGAGKRSIHIENLSPKHLPYLKRLGIHHFQPSVSDLLTLENTKKYLDPGIEFDWLLYAYRLTEMDGAEIERWVSETVEAGVTSVRTQFGAYALAADKLGRVGAFLDAFKKYEIK